MTTGYIANGHTYDIDHGYASGDSVVVSGAAQTKYNGTFTITVTGTNTFTYTVSGTPASPATGTIYQKLSGWNTATEVGLFIGDILSGGSASSYGAHCGIVTVADPDGTAKERGLLITIDRRPGCPLGSEPDSFSRGIEISSAGSITDYSDNLTAGDGIVIFGPWNVGIRVDPLASYNGFGTLSPSARLHVAGPGDETIKLETTYGSGSAWSLSVKGSDGSLRLTAGSDTTSYSPASATTVSSGNVDALGVVGTTDDVNINLYSRGAAARKATIQAVVSGTQGAQLRFYVKPDSGSDVAQAGYFEQNGGFVLGSATGGSRGGGTLNVSGDIYKNGTAYTNPDYVFDHWLSGTTEAPYRGRIPLSHLREFVTAHRRLPGISDEPTGIFARGDVLLEKIEEAYLYILELHDRIEQLTKVR